VAVAQREHRPDGAALGREVVVGGGEGNIEGGREESRRVEHAECELFTAAGVSLQDSVSLQKKLRTNQS